MPSEVQERLKQFDTPTVSNALEFFELRPKNIGFLSSRFKSAIAIDTPMVGYAVTAECSAVNPPTAQQIGLWEDYYRHIRQTDYAVAVIKDIDPNPIGSFWGEVNVSTHKALGCVGTVTDGGVRDLSEVEKLDFGYFSTSVLVSHAYIHLESVANPVFIDGVTIKLGNLIHADRHGVLIIPDEIDLDELIEACTAAMFAEEPVIQNCKAAIERGQKIEVDELMGWRREMLKRKKESIKKFSKA